MPPPLARAPGRGDQRRSSPRSKRQIDAAAAAKPNPGARTFQRLNRAEYARAIRDLLALDVDAGNWLPLDTKSANFDNIADAQALSPTLLEAYLNAAAADQPHGGRRPQRRRPIDHDLHQRRLRLAAPVGSRRRRAVRHARRHGRQSRVPGRRRVRLRGGARTRATTRGSKTSTSRSTASASRCSSTRPAAAGGADGRGGRSIRTEPILVRAGQQRVAAAFVRKVEGPYEDLIRPHDWSFAGGGSGGPGITTLPHVRDLIIKGPYKTTGISETAEPPEIFTCRPTTPARSGRARGRSSTRLGERGVPAAADARASSIG